MGWFGRLLGSLGQSETEDTSVAAMRARAAGAEPAPPPPGTAQPGDGSFRMPVQDVFVISGRGTVATGVVEAGTAEVGQAVHVVRGGAVVVTARVRAIEKFRAELERAEAGESVGLLLDDVTREQVQSGDVLQG